ncbi:MAG: hypothetical protein JWO48_1724 [Bryobacterales bacterium]|nr:hypothetical protein [Bryobacterales bacterium]
MIGYLCYFDRPAVFRAKDRSGKQRQDPDDALIGADNRASALYHDVAIIRLYQIYDLPIADEQPVIRSYGRQPPLERRKERPGEADRSEE